MARCRYLFLSALVVIISCCVIPTPFIELVRSRVLGCPKAREGHVAQPRFVAPYNSSATGSGTVHGSATTPAPYDATERPESLVTRGSEDEGVNRELPAEHQHAAAGDAVQGQDGHHNAVSAAAAAPMGPAGAVVSRTVVVPATQTSAPSPATDANSTAYAAAAAATAQWSDELGLEVMKWLRNKIVHFLQAVNETDAARIEIAVAAFFALLRGLLSALAADDRAVAHAIAMVMQAPADATSLEQLMNMTQTGYPELAPQLARLPQLEPAQQPWYASAACTLVLVVIVLSLLGYSAYFAAGCCALLLCALVPAMSSSVALALTSSMLFDAINGLSDLKAVRQYVLAKGAFRAFKATIVGMLAFNTVWMAVLVLGSIFVSDLRFKPALYSVVVWWCICSYQAVEIWTYFRAPVLASLQKPQTTHTGVVDLLCTHLVVLLHMGVA